MSTLNTNSKTVYSASDIWGAAALAQRVNGAYLKQDEWNYDNNSKGRKANRDIAKAALLEGTITDADREKGLEARQFLSGRLTMKALTKRLSDFEANLATALALDEFIVPQDRMQIGIVNSQIAAYERTIEEERLTENAVWGYVSEVGMRVDTKVTPTARFWVDIYGTFRYNAITKDGYKISFYNRERLEIGNTVDIRGTVKKQADNVTTLNRVKIKGTK